MMQKIIQTIAAFTLILIAGVACSDMMVSEQDERDGSDLVAVPPVNITGAFLTASNAVIVCRASDLDQDSRSKVTCELAPVNEKGEVLKILGVAEDLKVAWDRPILSGTEIRNLNLECDERDAYLQMQCLATFGSGEDIELQVESLKRIVDKFSSQVIQSKVVKQYAQEDTRPQIGYVSEDTGIEFAANLEQKEIVIRQTYYQSLSRQRTQQIVQQQQQQRAQEQQGQNQQQVQTQQQQQQQQ